MDRSTVARVMACAITLVFALMLPQSARAGWPLESKAAVALGFGATYTSADGTPSTHRGLDVSAAAGSKVSAPLQGRVSFVGRVPGVGGGSVLAVTVTTESGSLTLLPLSSACVAAGAEVGEGEPVGLLAADGDASSATSHLHIGARRGDLYVDPMSVLTAPMADAGSGSPEPDPVVSGDAAEVPNPVSVTGRALAKPPAEPLSGVESPLWASSAAAHVGAASAGAPAVVAAPGAQVAPGVSVAGAMELSAGEGAAPSILSAAVARGIAGGNRSREGSLVVSFAEWVLSVAARGLQTGARVLAGALLALGTLWPIWRRERRKDDGQLAVRPVREDVAAVAGR